MRPQATTLDAGQRLLAPDAGRPRMQLIAFKPIRKGPLIGFATIQLPIGLTIEDCPVCISHGKTWASLPSKPLIDPQGVARRDPKTGKPAYVPLLRWRSRDLGDRWSAAVVELVRQHDPAALDGGAS